jgi:hypothetical protein
MRRFTIIVTCCLSLASCDKQQEQLADEANPASSATALRRVSSVLRVEPRTSAAAVEERFAAITTLSGPEREKALAAIAWETIETDEPSARRAYEKMAPATPEKIRLIQHFASRLCEENPEEAITWALAMEHPSEQSAALSAIAVAMAEAQPQRAADLLSQHGEPGHELDVAAVQVIQRWAAQSAPDAAAWVTRFPDSSVREAGLDIIAARWLPADAAAAFRWLDAMPASALRQETALALQGVLLTQPSHQREQWLQSASPTVRSELDAQTQAALQKVGNNVPTEP